MSLFSFSAILSGLGMVRFEVRVAQLRLGSRGSGKRMKHSLFSRILFGDTLDVHYPSKDYQDKINHIFEF